MSCGWKEIIFGAALHHTCQSCLVRKVKSVCVNTYIIQYSCTSLYFRLKGWLHSYTSPNNSKWRWKNQMCENLILWVQGMEPHKIKFNTSNRYICIMLCPKHYFKNHWQVFINDQNSVALILLSMYTRFFLVGMVSWLLRYLFFFVFGIGFRH